MICGWLFFTAFFRRFFGGIFPFLFSQYPSNLHIICFSILIRSSQPRRQEDEGWERTEKKKNERKVKKTRKKRKLLVVFLTSWVTIDNQTRHEPIGQWFAGGFCFGSRYSSWPGSCGDYLSDFVLLTFYFFRYLTNFPSSPQTQAEEAQQHPFFLTTSQTTERKPTKRLRAMAEIKKVKTLSKNDKPRLRWTPQLHKIFLTAISELSSCNKGLTLSHNTLSRLLTWFSFLSLLPGVSPAAILKIMNSKHTGAKLSRIKIASHLQKYRSDLKQGLQELEIESTSSSPDASFPSSFTDSLCLSPLSVSPDDISSTVDNYPELNWVLTNESPTQSPEKHNLQDRHHPPPAVSFYPPIPVPLSYGSSSGGCQVVANFCPACGRSLNGVCWCSNSQLQAR